MERQPWIGVNRKNALCVDSYDAGVLTGRLYTPLCAMTQISGLSDFLIKMEDILDELQMPQSYTEPRRFASLFQPGVEEERETVFRRGGLATFEFQVLFRQHSSWQGTVCWRERGLEHSFRSVLELVILMDSALRGLDLPEI